METKVNALGEEELPLNDGSTTVHGEPQSDPNEVSADSVAVPGLVRDSAGNTWTIPEEDDTELLYKSPFDIKKEPGFYYQFEHKDNVAQMMTEGFKPVTRKEIGLQGFTPIGEYGVNVDSVYQIHEIGRAHV